MVTRGALRARVTATGALSALVTVQVPPETTQLPRRVPLPDVPSQTSAVPVIPVVASPEVTETVTLTLQSGAGYATGTPAAARHAPTSCRDTRCLLFTFSGSPSPPR